MAFYTIKNWKNRDVEFPGRRTLTDVLTSTSQTVDVTRSEGTVTEAGDTFDENGYQTLSLNYFLDYIDPSIGHTWDVALEVSGGSFQIANHEVHTLIWGQGLSKVEKWDGKIKISDELALYLLKYQPVILKTIAAAADVDLYTSEVPTAADQVGRDLYQPNNIGYTADYVIITVGEPDVNNIFFTGEDYAGDPISTGLI